MTQTILLIEGNEGGELGRKLRLEPYRLITARHPQDAMRFGEEPIDLIVCDLATARSNEFESLRYRQRPTECPPFVIVINAGDVESAVDAMKLGAVDCLTKPIDSEKLHELVGRSLGTVKMSSPPRPVLSVQKDGAGNVSDADLDVPAGASLEDLERVAIQRALKQHHGNRTHAAQELGISVRTLQRKLKAWRVPMITLHTYSADRAMLDPRW
jgi:DNA-binding NtrC family response regulator